MFSWSSILHRRREAVVRRLARVVSEARAALNAREGAIAGQLHRADHMRAKGRCAFCVEEAKHQIAS